MNKNETIEEKYVNLFISFFLIYIKRNMKHGMVQTIFFVKGIYFLVHNLFVH